MNAFSFYRTRTEPDNNILFFFIGALGSFALLFYLLILLAKSPTSRLPKAGLLVGSARGVATCLRTTLIVGFAWTTLIVGSARWFCLPSRDVLPPTLALSQLLVALPFLT